MSIIKDITIETPQGSFISGDIGANAQNIDYNNTESGLTANNVQDAIDEIAQSGGGSSLQNFKDGINGATIENNVTNNVTSGNYSHAEGNYTTASGYGSHIEGGLLTAENTSPVTLGLYEADSEGQIIKSNDSEIDDEKNYFSPPIRIIPFGFENPSDLRWCEQSEPDIYVWTEDTTVNNEKEYYQVSPIPMLDAHETKGWFSHAENMGTVTLGDYAHAEGLGTSAIGQAAHTEGCRTIAIGYGSHTEGDSTIAHGDRSHAEGDGTRAIGSNSHAEGFETRANGDLSHVEGNTTTALGYQSHAEGNTTIAHGDSSHAEGNTTTAFGDLSHAEGNHAIAYGDSSHAENNYAIAYGDSSHAEGNRTLAYGDSSHVEGYTTCALGPYSHAEGSEAIANGNSAHAEGHSTTANNNGHAEGSQTCAGVGSHAEGSQTCAIGLGSHTEGNSTLASGENSHAEGYNTTADNDYAHAEGYLTKANGGSSHTEGFRTRANGDASHAEGISTSTSGEASHAEGRETIAGYDNQHVQGSYNDNKSTTLFEIGNGTTAARSNAFEVYNDGYLSTDNGTTKIKLEQVALKSELPKQPSIPITQKGAANGVAELDSGGKVPTSQLPSYVDDVVEYASTSEFPVTGESGKIYIALDTNVTYRWGGSSYVEIGSSLALGETSSTAYYGDKGKTAYDHSQVTSGNPHNVTATDVGLGNVGNFKAVSTVASQGLTSTEQANARTNIGAGTGDGTITSVKMNGTTISTSGEADLGAVITSHQDISGKMDKANPTGTGSLSINRKAETTVGTNSVALGYNGTASGDYSTVLGSGSAAVGNQTLAGGYQNQANGNNTVAMGRNNIAGYTNQTVIGKYNDNKSATVLEVGWGASTSERSNAFEVYSDGTLSTDNGTTKIALQNVALKSELNSKQDTLIAGENITIAADGKTISATGGGGSSLQNFKDGANGATIENNVANNVASGRYAHAEGNNTTASGDYSHAEGCSTTASGSYSHAEGYSTTASGNYSHAEGESTTSAGHNSHTEGYLSQTQNFCAHAEGYSTIASGETSHAEGYNTKASGSRSHAEGSGTTASGEYAHAEGRNTKAWGSYSHAEGYYTNAAYIYQHVSGKYNSNKSDTLLEIGNGTSNSTRSNAFEIYSDASLSTDNGTNRTKLPIIRTVTLPYGTETISIANPGGGYDLLSYPVQPDNVTVYGMYTPVVVASGTSVSDYIASFYTSKPGLDYTSITHSD